MVINDTTPSRAARMIQRIGLIFAVALMFPLSAPATGPDILLKDLDGKERNLNEYVGQGKWTIVAVWSADCPICRRDIYHMTFFHDEHRQKDAVVVGVSIDGYAQREKVQAFIDDQSLNFPNLIGSTAMFGPNFMRDWPTPRG